MSESSRARIEEVAVIKRCTYPFCNCGVQAGRVSSVRVAAVLVVYPSKCPLSVDLINQSVSDLRHDISGHRIRQWSWRAIILSFFILMVLEGYILLFYEIARRHGWVE